MKLVIDMSALDVEKRKMVVDYLQDNEVPITWAEHINKIQDIARLPFTGWDLAMSAPYGGSRYTKERAVDIYKATAEQILTQERNSMFNIAREAKGLQLLTTEEFEAQYTTTGRIRRDHVELQNLPAPSGAPGLKIASGCELDYYGKKLDAPRRRGEPDYDFRQRLVDIDRMRTAQEWADAEARRRAGLFPQLTREEYYHKKPAEVEQMCFGTATKHRWAPTQYAHQGPDGVQRPILECVHCYARIYGPYDELPLHLLNEDDPRVNTHHPD